MIGKEREAEILRLHHAEKWPVGTIAAQLGHHHSTLRRVLAQAGLHAGLYSERPSIADPYLPFILETLATYPRLCASRLYAMVKARGVPRVLLYDNLKSAVLERAGDAIRFHPTLLELAAHYRFQPRPVAPARGNEKGRVERAIRYVRDAFFAARPFQDLDDLNAQALSFCQGESAARRCPEDRARSVREVFADEQGSLLPLPGDAFAADERVPVEVGKTPYVRFDLNDYSVPHTCVRRTLVVIASPTQVRVLDGMTVVATHARSFDRGQQIEDPAHIEALVALKHKGQQGSALDRLHHALPHSRDLLRRVAEHGGNVGRTVFGLTRLLDAFAAEEVDAAVAEALSRGTPNASGAWASSACFRSGRLSPRRPGSKPWSRSRSRSGGGAAWSGG